MDGKLIISKEPMSLPLTGFHVGSTPCLIWRHEPERGWNYVIVNTKLRCPAIPPSNKRNATSYTPLLDEENEFTQR